MKDDLFLESKIIEVITTVAQQQINISDCGFWQSARKFISYYLRVLR